MGFTKDLPDDLTKGIDEPAAPALQAQTTQTDNSLSPPASSATPLVATPAPNPYGLGQTAPLQAQAQHTPPVEAQASAPPAPEPVPIPQEQAPPPTAAAKDPVEKMLDDYLAENAKHPYENKLPEIKHFEQPKLPEAAKPPKKEDFNLWAELTKAGGAAVYGAAGGFLKLPSAYDALVQGMPELPGERQLRKGTPFALKEGQQKPYETMEERYKNWQGKQVTESAGYKAGEIPGEALGYAAFIPGLGAGAGLARALGFRAAEGGAIGGLQSAEEQMRKTGKIDAGQLAQGAALGAPLNMAGELGLRGAGKALGAVGKYWQGRVQKDQAKIAEAFKKVAEKGNQGGEIKPPQESITPPAELKEPEVKGPFAYLKDKKGFDIIKNAKTLEDILPALTKAEGKMMKEALKTLGEALGALKHAQNEAKAFTANAAKLASLPSQMNKIKRELKKELNSTNTEKVALKRSELHLEQELKTGEMQQAKKLRLQESLKNAAEAAQKTFQNQLEKLEEAIRESHLPDLFKGDRGKHLRGYLDEADLYSKEHIEPFLAKTYEEAYDQALKATKDMKALESQYDAFRKHNLDFFNEIEKKVQKHFGNEGGNIPHRLHLAVEVRHPLTGKVTAPASFGLVHNPFMNDLHGIYARQLKAFIKQLEIEEGAMKEKEVLSIPLKSSFNHKAHLLKEGLLHPNADKIMVAAALAIRSDILGLDTPAHAQEALPDMEDITHAKEKHDLGNAAMALAASVLFAKYGYKGARALMQDPQMIMNYYYVNTNDLLKLGDMYMHRSGYDSIANKMNETVAKIYRTQLFTHDENEKVTKVLFGGASLDTLAENGQAHARDALSAIAEFKKFAEDYAKDWHDHVSELGDDAIRTKIEPVTNAINFVNKSLNGLRHHEWQDTVVLKIFSQAAQAWFNLSPKTYISGIGEFGSTGILQMGPKATSWGMHKYVTSPELRGLVNRLHVSGPRTQALNMIDSAAKPVKAESIVAGAGTLGSLSDFYTKNPKEMAKRGITSAHEFSKKILTGEIDEDIQVDAFSKVAVDLSEMIGYDPLDLNKGPFSRSPIFSGVMRFYGAPERYARQMVKAAGRRDIAGIVMAEACLQQFAGKAAIPKSVEMAAWTFGNPYQVAIAINAVNATSVGYNLLGDMSSKSDWDPFFYPLMGVISPGVDNTAAVVGDLVKDSKDLGEALYAIKGDILAAVGKTQDPLTLVGDKKVKANLAAQKAVRNALNSLSMLTPPTAAVAAFQYNLPGAMLKEFAEWLPSSGVEQAEFGVPSTKIGSSVFPLEAAKPHNYVGAKWAARRQMLRMPPGPNEARYQLATQALKVGKGRLTPKEINELNKMQAAVTGYVEPDYMKGQ